MLKSFVQIAWKKIIQFKSVYLINVLGLSAALSCCVVIFVFVDFEYSVDSFHEDPKNIFLITQTVELDHESQELGKVPKNLGPEIKRISPEVQYVVNIDLESGVVNLPNKNLFYETITFTNPEYLDVFNFPLKSGSKDVLNDLSKIIISERLAIKYFANANPVDEVVNLTFLNKTITVTIGGVVKEFNKKRSFEFDILLNRDVLLNIERKNKNYKLW